MAAYCTASDVQLAAGKYQTLSAAETTAVTAAIPQAQSIVERITGTFFDQRHLQITTEAVQYRQKRLFMPAPILSIDGNAITENGISLTVGPTGNVLLYQPTLGVTPLGVGWLEKAAGTAGWLNWPGELPAIYWTTQQQGVVVPGVFGYASVPLDITKVTAWKTAEILGWITLDYTDGGGVSKAIMKNGLPDWAMEILRSRSISHQNEQYFNITALS